MITIPFFADQLRNSLFAEQFSFAESLNRNFISTTNYYVSIINRVLDNIDNYRTNIRHFRRIFIDRIIHPLDEGTFWIEKTIRTSNQYLPLKLIGANQSICIYYYIDLLIIIVSCIYLIGS
jgi:hypothetical protein